MKLIDGENYIIYEAMNDCVYMYICMRYIAHSALLSSSHSCYELFMI